MRVSSYSHRPCSRQHFTSPIRSDCQLQGSEGRNAGQVREMARTAPVTVPAPHRCVGTDHLLEVLPSL